MWRSAKNLLGQLLDPRREQWHPLLAVYYLTYACDFRCPYCSDGAQHPYYTLRAKVLRAPEVLTLLGRLRQRTDYLIITGGEPLKHPDFAEVLQRLPALRFDGVVLTTNGFDIGPHLPAVMGAVQHLVFSIDTLDEARADACYGVGAGAAARIRANLERAIALRREFPGCELVISAVATPDNLDALLPVYHYARRHGIRYALCPQLCGVKAHPALHDNPGYRRVYDQLISEKKRGHAVNGTVRYLTTMRDLSTFDCRPGTMVAVAPTGDVFYPCLERGQLAGNLLTADLEMLRARGRERFGPEPDCDNRCHSACALSFALLLGQPLTMLDEAYRSAKGWLLGRTRPETD